jgi:alkylated DNA repair protein alkB family protein 8
MLNDSSVTTHQLRSVLPHEPLPKNDDSDDTTGWLHVQGAFAPRSKSGNRRQKEKEKETEDDELIFWTRETLQEALVDYFAKSQHAYACSQVNVLDQSPPYTKIRLGYNSIQAAFHAMMSLKERAISPTDVFADKEFSVCFSQRPLQITLLTKQPFTDPGWNRSNPPKFRRLLATTTDQNEFVLQKERQETRFVWINNLLPPITERNGMMLWNKAALHRVADAIRSVVNEFDSTGKGVEVFLSASSKQPFYSCYIGMRCPADAMAIINGLQERTVTWKYINKNGSVEEIGSGVLFLDYIALTRRCVEVDRVRLAGMDVQKGEATRPEDTSATAHVEVPGLVIIQDCISEAQEAALMAALTGPYAPWAPSQTNKSETGAVKRQVQHYGYVFDYRTADVLRDRAAKGAECPPMPAILNEKLFEARNGQDGTQYMTDLERYNQLCVESGEGWGLLAGVIEQTRCFDFGSHLSVQAEKTYPHLNQLTINQYKPGEGIGSHVDTPSAFGDGLISLSLNSGIVMEFRKVGAKEAEGSKKLVYLPRRSMLLMSGAARYEWEHMIVTRTTDVHDGNLLPRATRVSLTFRTALDIEGHPMPLVESDSFPPTWGRGEQLSTPLRTPACERDHVHAVYDAIAVQWHHTRGRRGVLWPGATEFLHRLEPGSIVADVGCGDGKYFPAIWKSGSYVIGSDISIPLLRTAFPSGDDEDDIPENRRVSDERRHLRDRPAVCAADCMNIPFKNHSFDAAICIAVLHHLSTKSRRRRCIEELARIVKPGGLINIQAWAITQKKDSRRQFAANDVFVPFNAQPKYLKALESHGLIPIENAESDSTHKSMAQVYSEALDADFDDRKGLVVFKRYCHMYKEGELEELLDEIPGVELVESGFEAGNYFIILKVRRHSN